MKIDPGTTATGAPSEREAVPATDADDASDPAVTGTAVPTARERIGSPVVVSRRSSAVAVHGSAVARGGSGDGVVA